MNKIRWTVIGAGGIADRRAIPALLEDDQNEIVAVMDRVESEAQRVAEKFGVPAYFTDAEEMLAAVPCDAVYIGTPVACHYEQAMTALKYGVHTFIEKPIAMTEAEGRRLLEAFQAAGKQLMIGYMMGYHNLHKKARELVQTGGLGTLNLVRMQFSCWYPEIAGAWRQKKSLGGGGCFMDLAVHCLDLFTTITGDSIADCCSYVANRTFSYETEDSAMLMFRSKQGVLGTIAVNFNIPDACAASKLEIYGTDGSLVAEGTMGQEERGSMRYVYSPQGSYEAQQSRTTAEPQVWQGGGENIYLKQFKDFNSLLTGGRPNYDNVEKSLAIQAICDRVYQNV
ncbi:MAG: Gfo/Idh/MocA family oxidoreductase [Clostridia bacterium]|nr:Gfo/Idh/MocA family oxidoreductase [Clostridia bacterium]